VIKILKKGQSRKAVGDGIREVAKGLVKSELNLPSSAVFEFDKDAKLVISIKRNIELAYKKTKILEQRLATKHVKVVVKKPVKKKETFMSYKQYTKKSKEIADKIKKFGERIDFAYSSMGQIDKTAEKLRQKEFEKQDELTKKAKEWSSTHPNWLKAKTR
jgi:hypothetical protein